MIIIDSDITEEIIDRIASEIEKVMMDKLQADASNPEGYIPGVIFKIDFENMRYSSTQGYACPDCGGSGWIKPRVMDAEALEESGEWLLIKCKRCRGRGFL
jgi:DNA-directed RNA polymerase subunit RPC12/RpoP